MEFASFCSFLSASSYSTSGNDFTQLYSELCIGSDKNTSKSKGSGGYYFGLTVQSVVGFRRTEGVIDFHGFFGKCFFLFVEFGPKFLDVFGFYFLLVFLVVFGFELPAESG